MSRPFPTIALLSMITATAVVQPRQVTAATFTGGTLDLRAEANGLVDTRSTPIVASPTSQFEQAIASDGDAAALAVGRVDVSQNAPLTIDVVSGLSGFFTLSSLAVPAQSSAGATFDVSIAETTLLQYDVLADGNSVAYQPFTQAQNLDDFTIIANDQFLPGSTHQIGAGNWRFTTTAAGMTSRTVLPEVDLYDFGGTTSFSFTAVPEPTAPLIMVVIGAAFICRRKRR
ncbi:MAG: hypothetical protein AAF670_16700 [Planctomycetota bacterium]